MEPHPPGRGEVTELLHDVRLGRSDALDRLIPLVYDELRHLAARQLGREYAPRTLNATALVHEAYVKLAAGAPNAEHRSHFLAVAARAMRQVLIEDARRRNAGKRGGEWQRTTLSKAVDELAVDPEQLIALDDALAKLTPRQRQVVELKYFGGMEEREIAEVLQISDRTVRREWVTARAWLYRELYLEP